MKRLFIFLFILILFVQLILLFLFVHFRFIGADEGLLLEASWQVSKGRIPYIDFFYVQMPLLPYIYAGLLKLNISSFHTLRLFLIFLSFGLGLVIMVCAYRNTSPFFPPPQREGEVALSVIFLYAFNGYVLTCHSLIKVFAWTDLFAFLCFFLLNLNFLEISEKVQKSPITQKKHRLHRLKALKIFTLRNPLEIRVICGRVFLAGIFLGIALNIRATVLPLVPLFVIWNAVGSHSFKQFLFSSAIFILGVLVVSPLSLYLFFRDPEAFVMNNLIFHLIWYPVQEPKSLFWQKITAISRYLLPHAQNFILTLLAFWGVKMSFFDRKSWSGKRREDRTALIAFSFAGVIVITYLFATPIITQYFVQIIPYCLIMTIPALKRVFEKQDFLWLNKKLFLIVFAALYFIMLFPYILIFIGSVREKDKMWEIKEVMAVARTVQQVSAPQDSVLSWWPGYVFFANRPPVSHSEFCGYQFTNRLKEEDYSRYHILNDKQITEIISQRRAKVLVFDEEMTVKFADEIDQSYRFYKEVGEQLIYLRRE
ncbi:MAG: hypothetical protein AB1393_04950 [Candidatus Edwardsbacteria bacterium]